VANEYVEVLYKLFEGSWEDAVVRDRERGIFTHPEKVHEIGHKGKYFDVPGYHLCEPSPQRTPVLYQAGASGAGKAFAAGTPMRVRRRAAKSVLRDYVADVRRQAAAAGRDPRKVLIYNLVTVIVDETDAKAQAKFEEYQRTSYDGALVFMSGWTGIDFGQYAPTDLVRKVETNAIVSVVEHLANGDKDWTIDELARWGGIGGLGPCSWARPPPWPTSCSSGSRKPTWTASTWPMPCPRNLRGRRRPPGARAAEARCLPPGLPPGHAAREALRRRGPSARDPPGGTLPRHRGGQGRGGCGLRGGADGVRRGSAGRRAAGT
jgi:hypothetical protein